MLPTKASVQLGKGDETVEVLGMSSERHYYVQPPSEKPHERRLIPPSLHRQRPEFDSVFSHGTRPVLDGQEPVGGICCIVGVVEHCLEMRLQVVEGEHADLQEVIA